MNQTLIIEEIKCLLIEAPYDIVHDIRHHYNVWQNCLDIIKHEDLEIDEFSLFIAAWSHDLETYLPDNNNFNKLKNVLKRNDVDEATMQKIIEIIEKHSFSENQDTIESRILFDADKIEYLSPYRWSYAIQAFKDGELNSEKARYYEDKFNRIYPSILQTLHFDFSKEKFRLMEKDFIELAAKHKLWEDNKLNLGKFK